MDYKNIELYAQDNKLHSLKNHEGKKIILYFYPRDNTPGCTLEATDFTRLKTEFEALNAMVIGVSRDSVKSHKNFCIKKELSILLLSDPDEVLCKAFDVIKLKKNYGKEYMGIERSTFVLDEDGKIINEYRKVKTKGHAEAVLEYVKSV